MSTETLTPSRSKRRWYQFSLRTLIFFTALVAVGCGWFVKRLHDARQRRQVVEAIRATGRTEFSGSLGFSWLEDDSLGIYFPEKSATDASLAHLKDISQLRLLYLYDTSISDTGLEYVKTLPNLRVLLLSGTSITDDGLDCLKNMAHLGQLSSFYRTAISDAGLEHILGLSQLHVLVLSKTEVSR